MTVTPLTQEICRVLKGSASLGSHARLQHTLQEIEALDRAFQQKGGVFFEAGGTAAETAESFTRLHVDLYRQAGRPSLPMLAVHHAEKLGLDKNSPEYRAMMLVAVRAEMQAEPAPDYHNRFHFADVTAVAAVLLEKSGAALTQQERALVLIAALGHDLDHDGSSNPTGDPLRNEDKSFALMLPLLQEAGLSAPDIEKIRVILTATSPNGPHAILKAVAHAQREGRPADFEQLRNAGKFPALKALALDPKLTQMAAIVSDADLYASAGAGLKSSMAMSELLTRENRKSGGKADYTQDAARLFFLDNVVGREGFTSAPGRALANGPLQDLRAETLRRLNAPRKGDRPPPGINPR